MSDDLKWWRESKPLTLADFNAAWRDFVEREMDSYEVVPQPVVVSPSEFEAMMSTTPSLETVRAAYRNGLTSTEVNEARRERGIAEIPEAVWVGLTIRLLGRE